MAEKQLPSLTDLCTICHMNVPKYRCPGCSSRTCSLSCSKRHKLWSQCSGVRDPAAYLKKKELTTPAAFDKDFNFITGIERSLERADRDAEHRGLCLDLPDGNSHGNRKRRNELAKGEIPLQKGIEKSGVKVIKAPKGMTRSKQNQSHWNRKYKSLSWSVEWVFPNGQIALSKCVDATEVGAAFYRTPLAKELGLVEENNGRATKKRKIAAEMPVAIGDHVDAIHNKKVEIGGNDKQDEDTAARDMRDMSRTLSPELPENPEQPPPPSHTNSEAQPQPTGEGISTQTGPSTAQQEKNPTEDLHFYLHRPRTRTAVPVLIPISGSITLAELLYGRTVLEFPTIYALQHPQNAFPEDKYMLERNYQLEHGGEQGLDESGESSENEEEKAARAAAAKKLAEVDEMKVLEVLRKDLENQVDVISKLWRQPRLRKFQNKYKHRMEEVTG